MGTQAQRSSHAKANSKWRSKNTKQIAIVFNEAHMQEYDWAHEQGNMTEYIIGLISADMDRALKEEREGR